MATDFQRKKVLSNDSTFSDLTGFSKLGGLDCWDESRLRSRWIEIEIEITGHAETNF